MESIRDSLAEELVKMTAEVYITPRVLDLLCFLRSVIKDVSV